MDLTIIQQGSFTSTGEATIIPIRSNVDWMSIYNYTVISANQTTLVGYQYYWQRGMAPGTGVAYFKSDAAHAANLVQNIPSNGFTLINTAINTPGAPVALTAISTATPPVVTTASTAALTTGDIVRISNVAGAQQLGGLDFTINVINGTTFSLLYMGAIAAGTNGFYRVIPYVPYFYPSSRYISSISQAVQAVVVMTVTSGFTAGQQVRFDIPAAFGMTQLDGVTATVLAVNAGANSITINVDTTGFTAFTFPLSAAVPFTPAQVIPVGESNLFPGVLDDATTNQAIIGMGLGGGINYPAGNNGDQMYWVAGKSFSVSTS